jgi:hypothetical protein
VSALLAEHPEIMPEKSGFGIIRDSPCHYLQLQLISGFPKKHNSFLAGKAGRGHDS